MNNEDYRNEAAAQMAELLEIAQAMKKFQRNVQELLAQDEVDPETWEAIRDVSPTMELLCDYVIESITVGARLMETDEFMDLARQEHLDE